MVRVFDAKLGLVDPMPAAAMPTDAWFEPMGKDATGREVCRLLIAIPGNAIDPLPFQVNLRGTVLRFEHLANIKGFRIFVTAAAGPEHASGPAEPVAQLLLEGPLHRSDQHGPV